MSAELLVGAAVVGALLGLVMGLLGGGGGVLAVPLLVFVVGLPVQVATTTSLVIVLAGSVAALVQHARAGRVDWRTGLLFGALGSVGAVLGSRLSVLAPPQLLLGAFSIMLFLAALAMLRPRAGHDDEAEGQRRPWYVVVVLASVVGFITGFFGVGGGFIIVPILVRALGFPVRRAAATSLVVLAVNSLVSLVARIGVPLDGTLTVDLVVAAALGATAGALLSPRVPAATLRTAFGWLTLGVAVFTAYRAVTGG